MGWYYRTVYERIMYVAVLHIGLSAVIDVGIEKKIVSEYHKRKRCVAANPCWAQRDMFLHHCATWGPM